MNIVSHPIDQVGGANFHIHGRCPRFWSGNAGMLYYLTNKQDSLRSRVLVLGHELHVCERTQNRKFTLVR